MPPSRPQRTPAARPLARVLSAVTWILLVACSESSTGGGSGGAAASAGGAGGSATGGGSQPKNPDDVTTPEDCHPTLGGGGADQFLCHNVTIELSQPLAAATLTVLVATDLGDTFTALCDEQQAFNSCYHPSPQLAKDAEPVTSLSIVSVSKTNDPDFTGHYAPSWVDVELKQEGAVVGEGHFDRLSYTCKALSGDDWCWEAEPVPLTVTPTPP